MLKSVENYVEKVDLLAILAHFSTLLLENGGIITLFSFYYVENPVEFVEKPHLWLNAQNSIFIVLLMHINEALCAAILRGVYFCGFIPIVFVKYATVC